MFRGRSGLAGLAARSINPEDRRERDSDNNTRGVGQPDATPARSFRWNTSASHSVIHGHPQVAVVVVAIRHGQPMRRAATITRPPSHPSPPGPPLTGSLGRRLWRRRVSGFPSFQGVSHSKGVEPGRACLPRSGKRTFATNHRQCLAFHKRLSISDLDGSLATQPRLQQRG